MSSEDSDRESVRAALRRLEADAAGRDRRTVTHREPTIEETVDRLQTIREHGVAHLAIEPEPEPFEPIDVLFDIGGTDLEVQLPGEVVQFSDDGPIVQFDLSEKTGVQIDRAVEALTGADGEADEEESESLAETNPFLGGASDTLGGQQRRSGSREAVTSDRLDAYMEGSSSEASELGASSSESPAVTEASEVSEVSAGGDAESDAGESEPAATDGGEWPSEEVSEPTDAAASSVIDALQESSEGGPAVEDTPEATGRRGPEMPLWWESLLTDDEPQPLEVEGIDEGLLEAAERREPGLCELRGALDAALVFVDGPFIYEITFEPRRKQRSLGWLLCRSDRISESDLRRTRRAAAERGCSVPEALVSEGLLSRATVEAGRRARLRELLPEVRKREFAEATFRPLERRPEEFTHEPLSLRPMFLDRVFRRTQRLDGEEFRATRERFEGQLIRPTDLESFPIEESPLDDRQTRFVDKVLDEPKMFEQLVRESTMYEKGLVRLVRALEQLGWVEIGDWDEETKTEKRLAQKLVQLKTRLEGDDRFERFDVHWTAHDAEIEESYEELSATIERLDGEFEADSHEAEVLAELRESIEENYHYLIDTTRRRELRQELKSKFQVRSAIQLYEDQLEQAQMQRDIPVLRDHCHRLLELNPAHEEAKMFLEKIDQLEDEE